MKLRHRYLLLAALGLVLPYWQFVPWVVEHHGLNLAVFVRDLFANRISAFFALDVVISAIVLIVFVIAERRRLGVRLVWLPIVAVALVGVSLGFPIFLFLRQLELDRRNAS